MSTRSIRTHLIGYLEAHGWQAGAPGPVGSLYRKKGTRLAIPVPAVYDEQDDAWTSAIRRLADVEGVDLATMRLRVEFRDTDVARLRVANDYLIADTIPLEAASTLLATARRLVRVAATTARSPKANIRGNFASAGDIDADRARMAHTEPGSFVVPVVMPLSAIRDRDEPLEGIERVTPEPSERRAMRTLATALTVVDDVVVQAGHAPAEGDIGGMVTAGVSREMLNAIGAVLAEDAVAEFGATFSWSESVPSKQLPTKVVYPREAHDLIVETARRFGRFKMTPGVEVLTGPIVEVRHVPDDPTASVVLQVSRHSHLAEVRVTISRGRVSEMLASMRSQEPMMTTGRVERGPRGLVVREKDRVQPLADSVLSTAVR